jgi:hypothetical protein
VQRVLPEEAAEAATHNSLDNAVNVNHFSWFELSRALMLACASPSARIRTYMLSSARTLKVVHMNRTGAANFTYGTSGDSNM